MPENRLSIIVPMHNASRHIIGCLDGILNQTVKDAEVILVDDGSTDDTLKKAQNYPFKIIRLEKNKGVAYARNYGVKNSSGRILVFVDSDVALGRDAVQRISSSLSEPETDAVSGIYCRDVPSGNFFTRFINLFVTYRFEKLPPRVSFIFNCFCAIKREAFEAAGGYNEKMPYYEDVEIGHKLTQAGFFCRLDPAIKVTHLKSHTHLGLLLDYFKKSVLGGAYYRHAGSLKLLKDDTFPLSLKVAGACIPLMLVALALAKFSLVFFWMFAALYFIFLLPFLAYLARAANFIFALKSLFFCPEFFLACQCGFIRGFLTGKKING